jgi:hypothetical protein
MSSTSSRSSGLSVRWDEPPFDTPCEAEQGLIRELTANPTNSSGNGILVYFHWIIQVFMHWVRLIYQDLGQRITAIEISLEKRVDETNTVVSALDRKIKMQDAKYAAAFQSVTTSTPTPSGSSSSGQAPTTSTTTHGPSSTKTTATQGLSGRAIKCSKCHARGHSADECRSTNPAAVRRRVAQNNKLKASRRSDSGTALTPSNLSYLPILKDWDGVCNQY